MVQLPDAGTLADKPLARPEQVAGSESDFAVKPGTEPQAQAFCVVIRFSGLGFLPAPDSGDNPEPEQTTVKQASCATLSDSSIIRFLGDQRAARLENPRYLTIWFPCPYLRFL